MNDITIRAAGVADARGMAHVLVDGWRTTYAGILPADFLASFDNERPRGWHTTASRNLPGLSAVC